MNLDNTKSIQVILASAVSANELDCLAEYTHHDTRGVESNKSAAVVSTGATAKELVGAPTGGDRISVKSISIYNKDTSAATVYVQMVSGSTTYTMIKATLAAGETLTWDESNGWQVTTTTGAKKTGLPITSAVLADGTIPIGSATNIAAEQTPSGDWTITRAGVASLANEFKKRSTITDTTAGAYTYLAAGMLGGIYIRDPSGAARSDVTDTAANIVAAMQNAVVGSFVEFFIFNNAGSADSEVITLTAGSGVTLSPTTIEIAPGQVGHFIARLTNVTASSEAVTIYQVSQRLEQGRIVVGGSNGEPSVLAVGTAGQRLTMNAGATDPAWTSDKQKWAMRIPSLSGIDTDGYHGGLAGAENAGDITLTDAGDAYNVADDGGTQAVLSGTSGEAGYTADYQAYPDTEAEDDALYVGADTPFGEVYFDVGAAGVYAADSCVWEYYNGATWVSITNFTDYTDSTAQDGLRPLQRDGCLVFAPPSDWAVSTQNSQEAYFIRSRVTAGPNITTIPVLNSANPKIASIADAITCPCGGTLTDVRVIDEAATVHTAADIKFAVINFTTGASSGVLTFAQDKRNDYFSGLSMVVAAGDTLGVLVVQEDGTNEMGPATIELGITVA